MRKQTKIAAIVSAAALLAVGASMTSFAATGWQEENGTWVYYDKDGEYVTNSWQKSGDNYFYLDDDGLMAVDSLIEDDENYYYVDSNGAMVTNQWIAIDNENYGDENEPEVHWYYFQANGKAYKKSASATTVQLKTINGKKYTFNENGQMLYGWVTSAGEVDYGSDAYTNCDYYFGGENDGAMTVGWVEIDLTDVADADTEQPGDAYWEADQTRWFYFKSSGKKVTNTTNQSINGRRYGFDEYGRMIAGWNVATDSFATASEYMYFSTPEDGARYTKGWFKVVPGYYLGASYTKDETTGAVTFKTTSSDYEDGSSNWYYAQGDGKIYASVIKSINGKKYAFASDGSMLSGFQLLTVDSNGNIGSNPTNSGKSTEADFLKTVETLQQQIVAGTTTFYYFSGDADADGSMKTGKYTITIDDADYTFSFQTSGADKGKAVHGYKSSEKKIYVGGMLLKASSDNKVEVVVQKKDMYFKMSVADFIKDAQKLGYGEITGVSLTTDSSVKTYAYDVYKTDGTTLTTDDITAVYVINTSGTVLTSQKKDAEGYKVTGAKDGKAISITLE
jgi:glucan-binding YG repeat protein